jgi:hypothetical protein
MADSNLAKQGQSTLSKEINIMTNRGLSGAGLFRGFLPYFMVSYGGTALSSFD